MKQAIFTLFFAFILVITGCGQNDESVDREGTDSSIGNETKEEFVIGLIPSQSEGEMETAMTKLQAVLEQELERPVKIDHYPAYNGVVEALIHEHIDMAYFGPLTYVIAHERSGAEAIITQLVDGEPYYFSYIITRSDSSWDTLDELLLDKENIDFAFASMSSTSGSLIPGVALKERGVFRTEDDHDFKTVRYTGSHDITAQVILNGDVHAGAIDSALFQSMIRSGNLDSDDYKIIWQSEPLFQYPWAVHPNMDDSLKQQLQQAFIGITDEEILNPFGASAFTTATNEDYTSLREAAIIDGRMDAPLD
ncbi:phosphonate ABC transporter substrate-binding protein [Anaerobacillus alkalilacustris]|uniref:Phosphonate ABC transporter substrate-binding protein n=1 Tax=Anaerobacillus alkalilacustris TaxID=393763 RepID=A0A1S2LM14_9BACI|nr:phosphate/phosphite/phosphonate ABC transporter substrate-binding protein [Anaerobacillus alkalilacustris]OIJ12455.1 phosphonate ABC transporter substrate-binding protein [Anaerobacillus alkalilacustris]